MCVKGLSWYNDFSKRDGLWKMSKKYWVIFTVKETLRKERKGLSIRDREDTRVSEPMEYRKQYNSMLTEKYTDRRGWQNSLDTRFQLQNK